MANIRESAGLHQHLAVDDVGRGGDGRKLSPRHNRPPVVNSAYGLGAIAVTLGISGLVYVNFEAIDTYLKNQGLTPEQFVDAIRDALLG